MAISYRRNKNTDFADKNAENRARGADYVKPSVIYAFRMAQHLSLEQAAALVGFQQTWWNWRENGHMIMRPDQFAAAQAAAAGLVPVARRPPAPTLGSLSARIDTLQARVAELERALVVKQDRHGIM